MLEIPLPRDNLSDSGSDSDISDVPMGSAGSGDVTDHGNCCMRYANLAFTSTKHDPTTPSFLLLSSLTIGIMPKFLLLSVLPFLRRPWKRNAQANR